MSRYVWDIPNNEKTVYLTFDDGPTPEVTEWVLSQLKKYQVEATFFCIGNNIEKHPDIYSKVILDGHSIGNHTFDHLNGWKTSKNKYLENVALCEEKILKFENTPNNFNRGAKLFRPPYGRTKLSQAKILREKGYKIIMWDVLSADFDRTISPEHCLENVLKHVQSGSIIVFHDSVKAFPNLEYTLPRTLEFLSKNNYSCKAIRL